MILGGGNNPPTLTSLHDRPTTKVKVDHKGYTTNVQHAKLPKAIVQNHWPRRALDPHRVNTRRHVKRQKSLAWNRTKGYGTWSPMATSKTVKKVKSWTVTVVVGRSCSDVRVVGWCPHRVSSSNERKRKYLLCMKKGVSSVDEKMTKK